MADARDDKEDEAPLDPAMERVQQKLRKLMLVSGITLGVGFLAVLFAVIWRVNRLDDDAPRGEAFRSTVEVPAGSTLVDTAVDGDRLAVTVDGPGGRSVHLFHMPSGRLIGSTTLLAR
ncbi:hypothetical protein [Chthonobacter rhizosphaerae]|uniref:hypothetical protein n=1 Tax=Chthonobacter rhizosphaerae TaxID=2735553 RepID=UPI0015EFD806|nr:hypothetical protein [Chthonobacter rhizosphaerae]